MKHKMSKADRTGLWCSRVFIWFFIALMIFPVLWIVAASFSKGDSFFVPHCCRVRWGWITM